MKGRAVIQVEALAVLCSECGDCLPSPDNGSHLWFVWQVADAKSVTCACGAVNQVRLPRSISIGAPK